MGTLRQPVIIGLGFTLIIVAGLLDYLTGYELAFSLFYLFPIALVTWYTSTRLGLAMAVISAVILSVADVLAGNTYSQALIPVWNSIMRLGVFVIVVSLLSVVKRDLERETNLARLDPATGAVNSRFFKNLLRFEMERLNRYQHPFSLIYIDLDNFKVVNDQLGHSAGDLALRTVVACAKSHLRNTDIIARLGGDEFALLLPETNKSAIQTVVAKIQGPILTDVQKIAPPITFSIGALTCWGAPGSADQLIAITDQLMYSAKNRGKNQVAYAVYGNEPLAEYSPASASANPTLPIPLPPLGETNE